jgi:hypothetical protein
MLSLIGTRLPTTAAGDAADKTIAVPITKPPGDTGNLTLWLFLRKPRGGAILSHPQSAT